MALVRRAGKLWQASLVDDGTLDTVIRIQHNEFSQDVRFSQEYAAEFRHRTTGVLTKTGFRSLVSEAIDDADDL